MTNFRPITSMTKPLRIALTALLAALTTVMFSPTASALACNWTGGSGDWHNPLKWSCMAVPTDMDDVTLNLSSFGSTVTVNAPAPAKTLNFTSNGATLSGTGALLVSGLATINAITTTTISTNGSRLPGLVVSQGSGGFIFTLTDPALTADSLATVNISGVVSGGSTMVLDVGARNIGTLSLQTASLNLRAPITVLAGMTWFQGSVGSNNAQPLILAAGSVSTLTGGGSNLFTELITNGTLTWSGTGTFFTGNQRWTNNGTLNLNGSSSTPTNTFDSGLNFGGSSMPFFNYGTINANHSGTLKFESSGFNNHGTVVLNSGTLFMGLGPYTQYAGLLRFNGGNMVGPTKCCNLDASDVTLYGGVLSGGANGLYDIVGGIKNDGGTVLLDGTLRVTNFYQQTEKGSLAVTINGTNAGTDFGTMNVVSRPGVTGNGSVSLAGSLIVDRGPAFTPRSGDRFTIINAEGNVSGSTAGGSGSMYPAFTAVAAAGQVTVVEPTLALLVQAKADFPQSLRNGTNGYTLKYMNATSATINVSSPQVTMPIDFAYQAASSTGLTTTNPFVSDNTFAKTRTLFWSLPAAIAIPPGQTRTLHFNVTIGGATRTAIYRIAGQINAPAGITFSGVAPIDIKPTSALSSTTISVSASGRGTIQQQSGTTNIMLPKSALASATINLRTRISCPPEFEPCGNLRTVLIGQAYGGRYYNVRELTLDSDQSEPPMAARRSDNLAMRAPTSTSPSIARSGTNYGFWKGQIPGSGTIPGVPQKIYPDWDNHRPCIAFNGDGNGLYPVNCVGGDGDGGGSGGGGGGDGGGGGGDAIGTPQLYDPSGIISDATTGLPIVGATVSLYRQIPGLPDTPTLSRNCRTIDTRGGSIWTGVAPDTGVFEQPGFTPAQMSPDVNPQITGIDGRYGWNVVTGCWYVKVSAPGYANKISALVGVPPEVTDLHVALQPVIAGAVALTGVVSSKTHGSAGTFELPLNTNVAIGGAVSVEPRQIGSGHRLVFRFDGPVTAVGGVSAVDAASIALGNASMMMSGNEVTVTLLNIPDNKRVRVALTGVNGTLDVAAALGFMVGDVNSSRSVNASDISAVKARSGQVADSNNFRFDLNASGAVNASDISAVKARSGLVLP